MSEERLVRFFNKCLCEECNDCCKMQTAIFRTMKEYEDFMEIWGSSIEIFSDEAYWGQPVRHAMGD